MSTTIIVEIAAICAKCGTDLHVGDSTGRTTADYLVEVQPCSDCLDKAEAAGYDQCAVENGL